MADFHSNCLNIKPKSLWRTRSVRRRLLGFNYAQRLTLGLNQESEESCDVLRRNSLLTLGVLTYLAISMSWELLMQCEE